MIDVALTMRKNSPSNIAPPSICCENEQVKRVIQDRFDETKKTSLFGSFDEDKFWEAVNKGKEIASYFIDEVLPTLDWEILAVEVPFENNRIESNRKTSIKGRIDAVVRTGNHLVVVDHKTYNHIPNPSRVSMDLQLPFYLAMLCESTTQFTPNSDLEMFRKHQDKEVFAPAIMMNVISTSLPEPPSVLKSGKISKDKSQRTTKAMYMQALRDRGLDTDPSYLAIAEGFDDSRYAQQLWDFPSKEKLEWVWNMAAIASSEMKDIVEAPETLPCNAYNCSHCGYQSLCTDMRNKGQTPDVIKPDTLLYSVKEK